MSRSLFIFVSFNFKIQSQMKRRTTLLLCLIVNITIFAQTTYTFSGIGNWTDSSLWDAAPRLTINC